MFTFRHAKKSIALIDEFLGKVDQGILIFKEGVTNYLSGNQQRFLDNLQTLSSLESDADLLRRKLENILYTQSLMPQLRGDIMRLIEELDNILDLAKKNLYQFDVEVPFIPVELHADMHQLTHLSVSACESLMPGVRAFFREPQDVKEKLHRVYLFEKEADKLADSIKRKVFQEMTHLKLSEKFHLRYFTLHIETLSDAAERAADLLSIMALKRTI
ncbi:MAG: DUF47 family protein [Bacteroidia bacterium]|jgi:predicted phosphate transport protein (TIGR00153 family)|nr:DUF47 family protein [Bacteroidia bacterium]